MNLEEGQEYPLSKTKFDYLKYLFIDNGIVYSRGMIEDAIVDDISEKIINEILYTQLDKLIFENPNYSDKEKGILAMRWGLRGYKYHTLDEVASKYGVTRERIRQIEAKIMRKLRMSNNIKTLGKSL